MVYFMIFFTKNAIYISKSMNLDEKLSEFDFHF